MIGQYDGLAIRSATKVTEKVIAAATNLKVIGRRDRGHNVDIPAATAKGIIVMNTLRQFDHHRRARYIADAGAGAADPGGGRVDTSLEVEKNRFMGVEVTNKVLGLIGAGNIGSIVANRAQGLQMKVVA